MYYYYYSPLIPLASLIVHSNSIWHLYIVDEAFPIFSFLCNKTFPAVQSTLYTTAILNCRKCRGTTDISLRCSSRAQIQRLHSIPLQLGL